MKLYQVRVRYAVEMPLPIWRLMARAEARLNRDIETYFGLGASKSLAVEQ